VKHSRLHPARILSVSEGAAEAADMSIPAGEQCSE
jgi:hypothetical protein